MTRVKDWQNRLRDALEASLERPFALGEFDCATWAMECVDLQLGTNFAAEFQGKYDTPEDAKALCESRGWEALRDAADALLGSAPIPARHAQRGDVVWLPPTVPMLRDPAKLGALGICVGGEAAFVTVDGVRYLEMLRLRPLGAVVFRVGRDG